MRYDSIVDIFLYSASFSIGYTKMKHIKKIPIISSSDFKTFNSDGSMKHGIIKAFLKTCDIDVEDMLSGKIQIEDYSMVLVLHPALIEQLKRMRTVKALVSCQFRTHGHYAIAIPYKGLINA